MIAEKVSVTKKFTKKWFYTPLYILSIVYVILGGDTEKATSYVARKCFSVKVVK